jgi:hypothetical protein
MSWKKTDLLSFLAAKYKAVGIPAIIEPASAANHNSNRYMVNCAAIGKSADDAQQLGNNINIAFLVYDEGTAGEIAVLEDAPATVYLDKSIASATPGLAPAGAIYDSREMRARVRAAIVRNSGYVMYEADATPNHAERLAWAKNALIDLSTFTDIHLALVANDDTIQAAGGAAPDSAILNSVSAYIEIVSELLNLS